MSAATPTMVATAETTKPKRARKTALTASRLRDLPSYDARTGAFAWRVVKAPGMIEGQAAGSVHNRGYLAIRVDGKAYLCHRLAWLHVHGDWPVDQIDHINGVRSDNRIANLRQCSNALNCQNVRSHRDSTSQHVGVCYVKKQTRRPWVAQICVNGKQRRLGSFATESAALAAREAGKAQFHSISTSGEL